jgi:hypothetical protein
MMFILTISKEKMIRSFETGRTAPGWRLISFRRNFLKTLRRIQQAVAKQAVAADGVHRVGTIESGNDDGRSRSRRAFGQTTFDDGLAKIGLSAEKKFK